MAAERVCESLRFVCRSFVRDRDGSKDGKTDLRVLGVVQGKAGGGTNPTEEKAAQPSEL